MKIAINQPFIFPYIGYFQLISKVDKFILYDDVTFMKNSWINRNRILVNKEAKYFTIPLDKPSSFKLIKDTNILDNPKKLKKILKTFNQSYAKAPYYKNIIKIIETVFLQIEKEKSIAKIAYYSLKCVSEYLGIDTIYEFSSEIYPETKGEGRKERLYKILEINEATDYINLPGGINLYSKEEFRQHGFNLYFIDRGEINYKQFNNDSFVPWLSIIDILMFNSINEVNDFIAKAKLV